MFLQKLHHVKAFVFDIDGVLTDATVLVTEKGEQLRRFNIKDGYALQLAVKKGYKIAAISGGKSQSVVFRLQGLGITDVYLGVNKKLIIFKSFLEKYGLESNQVLYMGDDIPDLQVMKAAGVAVSPADAVEEVKAISEYISPKSGGAGCVRDVIEKVLKVQHNWYDNSPSAHDDSITSS